MFKSAIVAFTLAAVAQAISVEMPAKDTVWQSGGGAQTVSWEAVSTDATSFAIQLINQAGFLPNSPVTLVANQSTGDANTVNSVSVTFPNGNWPVGTAFQVNLVSSTNGNQAILAQSEQFNITSGGSSSAASATSAGSASTAARPTTMTMSSGTTVSVIPPVTNGNGGSSPSGNALPNAVTSTPSNAAVKDVYSKGALVSVLMGAAAVFGIAF